MDLNGEATMLEIAKDINWQLTRWTTRPIRLADGRNRLTFYGFGADGAEARGAPAGAALVLAGLVFGLAIRILLRVG